MLKLVYELCIGSALYLNSNFFDNSSKIKGQFQTLWQKQKTSGVGAGSIILDRDYGGHAVY